MSDPTTSRTPIVDAALDDFERDPYPIYAQLRRDAPIAWCPAIECWLVTRWDDCEAIGRDAERAGATQGMLADFFGPNVMTLDGAAHAWLRGGIDPPLRPKAVQGYIEQAARPVARAYVERVRARGACDAGRDVLEPISVRVVGDVLGYDDVDDEVLARWFQALSDGMTNHGRDPAVSAASAEASREVDEHARAAVARLTAAPDDSGLSQMIHAGTASRGPRTFEELSGTIRVLVLAGLQEPAHGAAASLLGLLADAEQLAAVLADPDANVSRAVHEGLRWLAPFSYTERHALQDIELHGVTIAAGDEIALALGSANRDEARYEAPDRFDLGRPRQTHAAFGYGAHFCAGHFISRRLEQIALEEVLRGLPGLRLDPDREPVVHGWAVRGVKSLPVVWDA